MALGELHETPCPRRTDTGETWIGLGILMLGSIAHLQSNEHIATGSWDIHITTTVGSRQAVVKLDHATTTIGVGRCHDDPSPDKGLHHTREAGGMWV